MDMGVPGYLLSDTMNLSVAQRLLRLLCPECRKEVKRSDTNQWKHQVARGYCISL
ncbi:MAG: hypothetical protein U5Q03_18030 [Bacteroidota bacterium]|nr:hypothetical protein [Bacteroidota bacterium]